MELGITMPGTSGNMDRLRSWLVRHSRAVLCLMILMSIVIRYILAAVNSSSPSMIMDEALYFSISRSLFESGEVLLRGQPVIYEYLLYPLIIAPLQLLPSSVSIFRAIQFFNAAAISLAAIPAFLIGKRLTGSSLKGLFIALFVLFMPDMVMVRHIMSESIVYPLTLALFYFFLLAIERKTLKDAVICGVLTFLLHTAKPGPIVIGATIVLLLLVLAVAGRNKKRLLQSVCVLGTFAVLFALYKLVLHFGLGVDPSAADYYARQMPSITWQNILNALNGALVYALYLPAAFIVLPLLLPLFNIKKFKPSRRILLIGLLISMVLFTGVIIWTIYIGEMTEDPFVTRIHTRYLAMYLPILLAFCLSGDMLGSKAKPALIAASFGLAAGWLLLAGRASVSGATYSVDSHLLSLFLTESPLNGHVWMPLIWIAITAYFLFGMAKKGFRKKQAVILSVVLILLMALSNASSYMLDCHNTNLLVSDDAEEARELAGDNAIFITDSGHLFWEDSMAVDMAYRGGINMVEAVDAIGGTGDFGVMHSFTPGKNDMALSAVEVPPAANIIIASNVMYDLVPAPSASVQYTSNNMFAVITPGDDGGWLHSALSGFSDGWVQDGSRFTLYDADVLRNETVYLQLSARAESAMATLRLSYGTQVQEIQLTDQLSWNGIYFTVEDHTQPLSVELESDGTNVYVDTYLIEGF